MKRTVPALVALVAAGLMLTGCSADARSGISPLRYVEVPTPDGDVIRCINMDGLALSCDWNDER